MTYKRKKAMENKQKIIVKSGLNQLGRATLPTGKEQGHKHVSAC